jgi:predicted nucleotidyltransferase
VNLRYDAAWEIHLFLVSRGTPYAIIGGTALPRWGEPRFTKDVDLVVMAPLKEGMDKFVQSLLEYFPSRVANPLVFARQTRMILIRASNHCDVDISLGLPGYEDEVMRRAVDYDLETGKTVRICSAEDLIIHKCVSGRPQDISDVNGVILRQKKELDVAYIRKWLRAFAKLTAPEVSKRFERALRASLPSLPRKKPTNRSHPVPKRK